MTAMSTQRTPITDLVGREDEMHALSAALTDASSGMGRLLLVSGQPGIGKTHLARAFASEAEQAGAICLFSHSDDDTTTPPYWLWVQIVRGIMSRGDAAAEFNEELRAAPDLIDALLPSRAARAAKSTFTDAQPAQVEFRLFSDLTRYLIDYSSQVLLVAVLENLHAADKQSLRLLEFVVKQMANAGLLIVGTYRDVAMTRKHPLFNTLGALAGDPRITRLRLQGLSRAETSKIIARETGQALPPQAIDAIFERTEGNPLFVTEIARGLAEELSKSRTSRVTLQIPDGIREAIGRRLNHLDDACNDALMAATVIGQTFQLEELAGLLAEIPPLEVLHTLEPAISAGIIETDEQCVRWRFSHALIRDALYDELPMARRLTLHRQFAEALVKRHAAYLEPVLGAIARHYYQAIQVGCVQEAVRYATAAAHHARKVLAFEEAIEYCELAIDALALDQDDNRRQTAELQLCRGRSLYAAGRGTDITRKVLDQSLRLAQETGHHSCFVETACEYVYQTMDAPSERTLAVCHTALDMVPAENVADRARLLVHKSVALKLLDRRAEAEQFVYEAIALAHHCGRHEVLCEVLSWSDFSLRGRPEKLQERIELGEQCLREATQHDDLAARVDAMKWLILSCQEAGATPRVKALAADFDRDTRRFRSVDHRYIAAGVNAYCALLEGAWQQAEALIEEAYSLGAGSGDEGAEGVYGAQMYLLNRELGRLPAMAPMVRQFLHDPNKAAWRPGLACILIEVGAVAEALQIYREILEQGIGNLPRDEMYLATLTLISQVCIAVEDARAAPDLYRSLSPYAGKMAVHPTAVCYGPVDLYLAELSRQMNQRDTALTHFEAALTLAAKAQSLPWQAYAQTGLASLLHAGGDLAECSRANDYLAAATHTAQRLGGCPRMAIVARA